MKIDSTPPVIAFLSRTPANGAGWNRTDVTAQWSCADGLSGVVAPVVSRTLTAEGAGLTAAGTCVDLAGNLAESSVAGINIDRTPPTLEFGQAAPPPSPFGWYRTDAAYPFHGRRRPVGRGVDVGGQPDRRDR